MPIQFQSFIGGQIRENAGAMDFIGSVAETKKAQIAWAEKPIEQKQAVLKNLNQYIQENSKKIANTLAEAQALPQNFILNTEVKKITEASTTNELRSPTGIILILTPARLNFKYLMTLLNSALINGNAIIIKPSKKDAATTKIISELFQNLFSQFSDKDLPKSLVQVLQGENEVADLMVSHPAVRGIAFQGKKETAEKVITLAQPMWKKLLIMSGYHNSALILPDADLTQVIPKLVQSCFLGMGQLRWNMSNILVTENQLPQFEQLFVEELSKQKFSSNPQEDFIFGKYLDDEEAVATKTLDQLKSEEKRVIWQSNFPEIKAQATVVRDLSHCSVLQQDCLQAPAVLISPVKYVHEMAKWANTGYYAQAAQIFGSPEKAQNMAAKIDAGVIFLNNWYESLDGMGIGYKQSAYGFCEGTSTDSFFSDKKIYLGGRWKS